MLRKRFFPVLLITLPLLSASGNFSQDLSHESSPHSQDSSNVMPIDSLQMYAQRANTLWTQEKSSLELAINLLSGTAENEYQAFYKLSTVFYIWSIQNASFENEKKNIENEVQRLLPLVSDSTKKEWESYLENEDPQLFREIIGFWRTQDPFSSTKLNERLIEHWRRINYAQANFDKANEPPYGTDDRGIFYVRMGPPNKISKPTIRLSYIIDPITAQTLGFELGGLINTEVEIWEYSGEEFDYFFMFAKEDGWGGYGLRRDAMELVDEHSIQVSFRNSYWLPQTTLQKISETALQYGVYRELSQYHPFFEDMFHRIRERVAGMNYNQPLVRRFQKNIGDVELLTHQELYRQRTLAPENKTSLKSESENLDVLTKTHRFLDQNNKIEYLFAIQPISTDIGDSFESMFLSNKLHVYDNQWNTLSTIDDLKKVGEDAFNNSYTYQISQSAIEHKVFYSSEIIDTTRNDILIPGRINPKTSAIVKSTGQEKISFSNTLDVDKPLLISDIIVGRDQEQNHGARLPISPSLDMRFDQNEDIMIYFETYNIPQGGYSFTYYFNKKRWLFGPRKIDEKSEVTIIAEDVKERDSQLFTINLDDLEPHSYELVFEFSPINTNSTISTRQKIIDFEIIE